MMISQGWFDELAVYAALVIFVPMIGAIGGNCGVQISTIIVRGLATGDLSSSSFQSAFRRESRIALIMSPACGLAAWLICRLGLPVMNRLSHASPKGNGGVGLMFGVDVDRIAFAVGLGMACAILIAALLGMMLPFLFRRIHIDPAIASGPIVTTANDIISVTVFLGLASAIMVW
jgi:magnesium transporter